MASFYVYRNLHRGLAFSVKYRGIVVDRLEDFVAYRVRFQVSEPGRARVLREQQKYIHAYVVAQEYRALDQDDLFLKPECRGPEVRYNPYKSGMFMCLDQPIHSASCVVFTGGRCYFPYHEALVQCERPSVL